MPGISLLFDLICHLERRVPLLIISSRLISACCSKLGLFVKKASRIMESDKTRVDLSGDSFVDIFQYRSVTVTGRAGNWE